MSRAERRDFSFLERETTEALGLLSLYSLPQRQFSKGVEVLKGGNNDEAQLGLAFLKFYVAAEKACEEYLHVFRPLLGIENTAHLLYPSGLLKEQFLFLHHDQKLISDVDYNVLYSYIENRNQFVHEGTLSLSRNNIVGFGGVVKDLLANIRRVSARQWGKLISLGLTWESGVGVRRVLTNDVLAALDTNDWIRQVLPDLDWWAHPFVVNERNSFSPSLPLQASDIVVTDREEVSPKNPARILLFERTLLAQDLDLSRKRAEVFLGYSFPVVFFIPLRQKDEFIEKLSPLPENVHLVTYDYDQKANLHLRFQDLLPVPDQRE